MPIPIPSLTPNLTVPYDNGDEITHIPLTHFLWVNEFLLAQNNGEAVPDYLAKPTAKYLDAVKDEARRCHADALEITAAGSEAVVFELFREGKSLQTMIRLERPRKLTTQNREVHIERGDPDHFAADYLTALPCYDRYYVGFAEEGTDNTGIELRVMPKIFPMEHHFAGIHPNYAAAEYEASALSSHSGIVSRDARANTGLYIDRHNAPVLMFFDPGRANSHLAHNLQHEQATLTAWQRIARPEEVQARARLDSEVRREIAADAKRLYAGQPTLYATRIRRLEKAGTLRGVLENWETSLKNKVWENGNWPKGIS